MKLRFKTSLGMWHMIDNWNKSSRSQYGTAKQAGHSREKAEARLGGAVHSGWSIYLTAAGELALFIQPCPVFCLRH